MSRTSLETQKLDLMDEVSYLKLKLVSMEETNGNTQPQDAASKEQNKAEVWKGLIAWILPIVKLLQAETAALLVWMKAFHSFYEKLKKNKTTTLLKKSWWNGNLNTQIAQICCKNRVLISYFNKRRERTFSRTTSSDLTMAVQVRSQELLDGLSLTLVRNLWPIQEDFQWHYIFVLLNFALLKTHVPSSQSLSNRLLPCLKRNVSLLTLQSKIIKPIEKKYIPSKHQLVCIATASMVA